VDQEQVVREIGRAVQRMAERTRSEEGYLPHPIAVAMAEAVRGGNLTDGDGTFGAQEHHYQVHMSKQHGHFALLDVANLKTGQLLAPEVVLRVLRTHDVLASYAGDAVQGEVAEGVVSGLLGIDDGSSIHVLRKAGLGGPMVAKAALLEFVERLPS
jgi:hypothetical protein